MIQMSNYIVFEGRDGIGKTEHSRQLARAMTEIGSTQWFYEPYDISGNISPYAKVALENKNITSGTRELLHMAARNQFYHEVLFKALKESRYVVCDRSFISGMVYAKVCNGIDFRNWIRLFEDITNSTSVPIPKYVVFMESTSDVPEGKEKSEEVYDHMPSTFHEKISAEFENVKTFLSDLPYAPKMVEVQVDMSMPPAVNFNKVISKLQEKIDVLSRIGRNGGLKLHESGSAL